MTITRRQFIGLCRDAAAAVAVGALEASAGQRGFRFRDNPFRWAVASGDPHPDGVVLWTRLEQQVLDRSGALGMPVPIRWEVADDEKFRRVIRRGAGLARSALGYSVHVEVDGLRPGRHYWYRFAAGGEVSATGRTRTAPAAADRIQRLRFAFASCQNYENGYYTAYRSIVEDDPDLVVFLGDYIYETGTMGPERAVRVQEPGDELFTLEQYRERYAHYKLDPDLQAAHLTCPWIVTSDDHEVSNDYAGQVPQNPVPPEQFLRRRAAAYQAYYEFTPLRRSSMPAGPAMRAYRRAGFGRLAAFHVLDGRQYRSDQPCGSGRKTRCAEALSPTRQMLGPAQERWLMAGLRRSGARWNILANQVMFAQVARPSEDGPTYLMDKWDGYISARQRLLRFFADARPSNPIVITGDIHSHWVADLKLDFDNASSPVVGTELVGTSISSGGDGNDSANDEDLRSNPHIKFYNARRGYVRCTLTESTLTSDFRTLPFVSRKDAPIRTEATFVVENGRPGAQRHDPAR